MKTVISRANVSRATTLIGKLDKLEESLRELKAATAIDRIHDLRFHFPSQHRTDEYPEKDHHDQRHLTSALNLIDVRTGEAAPLLLSGIITRTEEKIAEIRRGLEVLGVELG